jgi:hypothetical protein
VNGGVRGLAAGMASLAAVAVAGVVLTALVACVSNTTAPATISGEAGAIGLSDGGIVTCTTSLTSACAAATAPGDCPPTRESDLPGPWCATHPTARAITGSCHGYVVLAEPTGVNDVLLFVYDESSGALAALLTAPDLGRVVCLGGADGFSLPTGCFSDYGSDLLVAFDGPGAAPGCSAFDAGSDASASVDDGGDGGD